MHPSTEVSGSVNHDDDDVEAVTAKLHAKDAVETEIGDDAKVPGYKDTGYSWVILVAVMINYFMIATGMGAIGVLYPHFIEHFRCTMYEAAWIGSLHMSVGAFVGLFMAPVLNCFSCRTMVMVGSVIGTLGYTTSYLAQTVQHLYLTFGVFAGIGNGVIVIPSSVMLQQYFDKRRTLATALATTGIGVSPLVFAPLTQWLSETHGWRMAIFVLGCIYLQNAVAGSLLRPVPVTATPTIEKQAVDQKETVGEDDVQHRQRCFAVRTLMTSLSQSLNLSLLIDVPFIMLFVSGALAVFGYLAPFVFLPSYAVSWFIRLIKQRFMVDITLMIVSLNVLAEKLSGKTPVDAETAANLIAVMALTTVVGQLASGFIGDRMSSMKCLPKSFRQSIERRLLYMATALTLAGFATAGIDLWQGKAGLFVYSTLVGLLTGSFMVMQQPVLIDMIGLQRFAGAFGLLMMLNSAIVLASQPFSGWLKDVSGTFSLPFIVCGLMQASGGLLVLAFGVVRMCRGRKLFNLSERRRSRNDESDTV